MNSEKDTTIYLLDRTVERELIVKAQQGCERAFETLMLTYQDKIFYSARKYLSSIEDATDISQNVFIRAYKALGTFDSEAPLLPWLYQITRYECLNHIKHANRRRAESLDELEDEEWVQTSDPTQALPNEIAVTNERNATLRKVIEQMNPIHREVLILHHLQEMEYSEIAEKIGKPIGTVMSRLHVARNQLKKLLVGVIDPEN